MGKSMREEMMAMRKLVEEGHRIRADYAVQGKQAKAEKQKQLQELGPQRDALQKKKDELLVCLNSHIHPTGISEIAFIDSFKAFCEWSCRVFIEKKTIQIITLQIYAAKLISRLLS